MTTSTPIIPHNSANRKTAAPQAAPPTPSEPIEGAALLDELTAAFRRHLILPPNSSEALALWVMFTHAFRVWVYSPRIAITSPEWGCGKTTVLEILMALCPGGKIIPNASEAYVFHTTDASKGRPLTLEFDECDTFLKDKATLKSVLNAGFQVGSFVGRCEKDAQGRFVTRDYAIEAPIALAGIGDDWLWDALRSRSIVIPMKKPRPGELYEKYRPKRHGPGLRALAARAASWARENAAALGKAEPQMPAALQGRIADKWEPLIGVADRAGGQWPKIARRVALAMSGQREPMSDGTALLAALRGVFDGRGSDRLSSDDLCTALQEEWFGIEPLRLAALLHDFEIEPKQINPRGGGKQFRGYTRSQFEDAWARYLPPAVDGLTATGGGGEGPGMTAATGA